VTVIFRQFWCKKKKTKLLYSICQDLAFEEGLRLGYLRLFTVHSPQLLFADLVRRNVKQ
jgi:hypothetical protein